MRTLTRLLILLAPLFVAQPVFASLQINYDSSSRIQSVTGIELGDGNTYRMDARYSLVIDQTAARSGLDHVLSAEGATLVAQAYLASLPPDVSAGPIYLLFSGTDTSPVPGTPSGYLIAAEVVYNITSGFPGPLDIFTYANPTRRTEDITPLQNLGIGVFTRTGVVPEPASVATWLMLSSVGLIFGYKRWKTQLRS